MDILPHDNFVILERLEVPEKINGIMLPETNRERLRQRPMGRVLAIGPMVNKPGSAAVVPDAEVENPIEVGEVYIFVEQASECCHGLDGELRLWVRAPFIVGRVLRDGSATPERMKEIRAEAERLKSEREARTNLVQASGVSPQVTGPRLSQ